MRALVERIAKIEAKAFHSTFANRSLVYQPDSAREKALGPDELLDGEVLALDIMRATQDDANDWVSRFCREVSDTFYAVLEGTDPFPLWGKRISPVLDDIAQCTNFSDLSAILDRYQYGPSLMRESNPDVPKSRPFYEAEGGRDAMMLDVISDIDGVYFRNTLWDCVRAIDLLRRGGDVGGWRLYRSVDSGPRKQPAQRVEGWDSPGDCYVCWRLAPSLKGGKRFCHEHGDDFNGNLSRDEIRRRLRQRRVQQAILRYLGERHRKINQETKHSEKAHRYAGQNVIANLEWELKRKLRLLGRINLNEVDLDRVNLAEIDLKTCELPRLTLQDDGVENVDFRRIERVGVQQFRAVRQILPLAIADHDTVAAAVRALDEPQGGLHSKWLESLMEHDGMAVFFMLVRAQAWLSAKADRDKAALEGRGKLRGGKGR